MTSQDDEEMSEYSCWQAGQSEDGVGMPAHGVSPSRHTMSLSQTNSTAMMSHTSEGGLPHPWPATGQSASASGPSAAAQVPKNQRQALQKNMMGAVQEYAIDTPGVSPARSDGSDAERSEASEKRAYDDKAAVSAASAALREVSQPKRTKANEPKNTPAPPQEAGSGQAGLSVSAQSGFMTPASSTAPSLQSWLVLPHGGASPVPSEAASSGMFGGASPGQQRHANPYPVSRGGAPAGAASSSNAAQGSSHSTATPNVVATAVNIGVHLPQAPQAQPTYQDASQNYYQQTNNVVVGVHQDIALRQKCTDGRAGVISSA